jgi:hypothetical protein
VWLKPSVAESEVEGSRPESKNHDNSSIQGEAEVREKALLCGVPVVYLSEARARTRTSPNDAKDWPASRYAARTISFQPRQAKKQRRQAIGSLTNPHRHGKLIARHAETDANMGEVEMSPKFVA